MTDTHWLDLFVGSAALLACMALSRWPDRFTGWRQRTLSMALAALAALSLLHYLAAPPFRPAADRPLHSHDFTHYYLGAKYFPELGYGRLYVCFIGASGNDFGASAIRDLRDKQVRPLASVQGDPALACRPHFTPQRWAQFVADVATLRRLEPAAAWRQFLQDYGFNPPPTWLVAGHTIADAVPLSATGGLVLTLIDPLLLLVGLGLAALAFGLLPASLAVIALTTFVPAAETWTIGSLLRWDWLFWLFGAVAAARRGHPLLSGAAFGVAAATRVFPLSAVPVLLLCAWMQRTERERVREWGLWFAGCAAAALGLALLSLGVVDLQQWAESIRNLLAHSSIYSVNSMGLRTTLSLLWSLWTAGDLYPPEPLLAQLKGQSFTAIGWLQTCIALAVLASCRRLAQCPLWLVLIAALAWIPFNWTEVSSYYYMYWGLLALVSAWRVSLAIPLLACNVASVLLLAWLGQTPHLYAAISAVMCTALVVLLIRMAQQPASTAPQI